MVFLPLFVVVEVVVNRSGEEDERTTYDPLQFLTTHYFQAVAKSSENSKNKVINVVANKVKSIALLRYRRSVA